MKVSMEHVWKWLAYALLVCLMAIGVSTIMHDASYELSDDTIVQMHIGIGKAFPLDEAHVYSPGKGRFFPLGYQHFNSLLLLSPSGVSANMVYAFESVLWCMFLLVVFLLSKVSLPQNVKGAWRWLIPLCLTVIIGQRTLQFFTVLWTCSTWAFLLLALAILVWYYYCRDRKYWQLGILVLIVAYYTFCGETHAVVSFMIGLCAVLHINRSDKRDMPLIYSMIGVVVLFVGLYMALIYPYIDSAYDPAHGENVGFVENSIRILLNQKLLLLTIAIFGWRLYKVFVKKEAFDTYSDTLLATSIAIMSANLVLKLNYPIYYTGAILLSAPAYMRALDYSNKTRKILSIGAVVFVTVYFAPKYYKQIKSIRAQRTAVYQEMVSFDAACINAENIVWYMDGAESRGVEDEWAKTHINDHLKYLHHEPFIEYSKEKVDGLSEWLLMTPYSHDKEEILSHCGITEQEIEYAAIAASVRYYHIRRAKE